MFENFIKNFDFSKIQQLEYETLNKSDQLTDMLILGIELTMVYVIVKLWSYLVLNLLTPLNTFLSTKTDTVITGNVYPITTKQYIDDTFRAWRIMGKNMVIWMILLGVWYLIAKLLYLFIDGETVGIISGIVQPAIGFYFFGFSLLDYTSERRRLKQRESVIFVKKNLGLTITLGAIYYFFFRIPEYGTYIGVVFAPIIGVIAATIATDKVIKGGLKSNPYGVSKKEK